MRVKTCTCRPLPTQYSEGELSVNSTLALAITLGSAVLPPPTSQNERYVRASLSLSAFSTFLKGASCSSSFSVTLARPSLHHFLRRSATVPDQVTGLPSLSLTWRSSTRS